MQEPNPDSLFLLHRVAALERRMRVVLCVVPVICGIVFVLTFSIAKPQTNDVLTAQRFVLCNENGTYRGMISTNKENMSLSLFDSDGSAIARFAVSDGGRPEVSVLNKVGDPMVRIFEQDGKVKLQIEEENPKTESSQLAESTSENVAYPLVANSGKSRPGTAVRAAAYSRSLADTDAESESEQSKSKKEDAEFSFDPNMQPSTGFTEIRTRRLTLIDDLDNTRALLSTGKGSTDLSLFDGKGIARARFSLLADGHPEITLRDDLGRPLIRIAERRGAVMLQVQDGRGYGKVILGQSGDQFGIDVSDELEEFGVRLRSNLEQPQLAIVGSENSGLIQMFARPDKSGLSISGRCGEPGAILSMLDNLRPVLVLQGEQKRTFIVPTEVIPPETGSTSAVPP